MIPKKIHYCWFGGKSKSRLAKKCIKSWKKYCPDYEIIEWNESNFDINQYIFAREAYESGKLAFVSDVARLHALLEEGGIYMDVDVQLISSLDNLLQHTAFTGFEMEDSIQTAIIGSEKNSVWIQDFLDLYTDKHFIKPDGSYDMKTNVKKVTELLKNKGFLLNNQYQEQSGYVTLYPKDYFCPKSWKDGSLNVTSKTVAIHHFDGSWLKWYVRKDIKLKNNYGIHFPFFSGIHKVLKITGIVDD